MLLLVKLASERVFRRIYSALESDLGRVVDLNLISGAHLSSQFFHQFILDITHKVIQHRSVLKPTTVDLIQDKLGVL